MEADIFLRELWSNLQKVSPSLREIDTILRQYWFNLPKVREDRETDTII